MTKFEIKKNYAEVSYKNAEMIIAGVTMDQISQDPEIIERKDTIEEAREALKEYATTVRHMDSTIPYFAVEEFYIEENEFDEDGEWISGGDVWDFTEMPQINE